MTSGLPTECSYFSPPATVILLILLCFEGLLFLIFTAVMFGTQVHSICSDETVSRGTGSPPLPVPPGLCNVMFQWTDKQWAGDMTETQEKIISLYTSGLLLFDVFYLQCLCPNAYNDDCVIFTSNAFQFCVWVQSRSHPQLGMTLFYFLGMSLTSPPCLFHLVLTGHRAA